MIVHKIEYGYNGKNITATVLVTPEYNSDNNKLIMVLHYDEFEKRFILETVKEQCTLSVVDMDTSRFCSFLNDICLDNFSAALGRQLITEHLADIRSSINELQIQLEASQGHLVFYVNQEE